MKKITLSWQPIQHSSFMPQQQNSMPADRNADALLAQQAHARVKEFQRLDSIIPIQRPRRSRLGARKENNMHRNLSKYATVALIAAIGIGVPALAKSTHTGKGKTSQA
jgi:hypothetical protein